MFRENIIGEINKDECAREIEDLKRRIRELESPPIVNIPVDKCIDGGYHQYPTYWLSVSPPACHICGKIMQGKTSYITK